MCTCIDGKSTDVAPHDANITGSCQSLIRSRNRNSTGLHHIDLSVLDISVVVEIKINSGGLGE